MDNKGFIKLHRKILDNPIISKPKYFSVWIYILLKANHEEASFIWNNKKVTLNRGEYIGSIKKISEDLGVAIGTVSNILKYLISESQVEIKSNNKFTLFKVLNYNQYQDTESKVENKLKTKRKQTETNKNKKNEKNEKNILYSKPKELQEVKNEINPIKVLKEKNPVNEIIDIFYQYSKNNRLFANKTERKATEELIKQFTLKEVLKLSEFAVSCNSIKYAPRITTPLQLQSKMGQLRAYYEQSNNKEESNYLVI